MEFGGTMWRLFWVVMLVLVNWWWCSCYGCWEQERIALLQLKASINHPNGTSLLSWVDGKESSDCCQWERVECNPTTGRVFQLFLDYTRDCYLGDWYLNASVFLPLEELKILYLSGNCLVGWFENEGSESLSSSLRNLEVLDLSSNYLNNSMLSSLGGLSSLKFLYLSDNELKGPIHIEDLDALSNLEELDLSVNEVDSFVTHKDLHDLSHLEVLIMDHSSLNKNFLQSIGVMTSLKAISLVGCGLNGTLPAQGWCELKNLQELDLSENKFEGSLPSCLGNLTYLRLLDLSHNQFTGNIVSSPLTNLTSLEYISLSYNHFHVPVSFRSFANHSNLKVILSDSNKLVVDPDQFQTWVPTFQLKVFSLSNCTSVELNVNATPPNFLFYQNDLRVVDLSHNNLGGKFPAWLLKNNTKLEKLYLRNNSFVGPIGLPSHPNPNISIIDISYNNLEGQIPTNMSQVFPNLLNFNVSTNAFEGNIPSCFGDMKSLAFLDLSNNQLSGGILPEHLAMGCSSLSFFKLSNNHLHGQIFPRLFNLTNLGYLYLDGNNFVGEIPNSLSNISLEVLDISNNHLSGNLPGWIGNMPLLVIAMSKNHLEGPIPLEFCKLDWLFLLDFSENNLSGSIPSCFNPSSIQHVHLNKNKLRGPMTRAFYNSSSLVTLDLRENQLTGNIPNWIGTLSSLSILLLKTNHFKGRIPIQICHLHQLSIMDLSHNNLSGPIPPCLSNITSEFTFEKASIGIIYPGASFLVYFPLAYVGRTKLTGKNEVLPYEQNHGSYSLIDVKIQAEFTTKSMPLTYKGNILVFMEGIDLSCNQLIGEIPPDIGNLSDIRALNLSHNNLTGSIPATFSNLHLIESLDLSYNHLNGTIPRQLTELNSLEVFSVAHNNLSGTTPDRKAQFATFEEGSYVGNPLLCGPPLHNNCTTTGSPSPIPNASDGEGEDSGFIDMSVFYVSFVVSYITVLLGIAAVLYINPYWRRAWFRLIELGITCCYYFVLDNFPILSFLRSHV